MVVGLTSYLWMAATGVAGLLTACWFWPAPFHVGAILP